MKKRICVSLPENLITVIDSIAAKSGKSRSNAIAQAVKYYADEGFLSSQRAKFQNEIAELLAHRISQTEKTLNARQNELLSQAAVNLSVLQRIVADNLPVGSGDIESYRSDAVQFIKRNNRVFRMDETMKGGADYE